MSTEKKEFKDVFTMKAFELYFRYQRQFSSDTRNLEELRTNITKYKMMTKPKREDLVKLDAMSASTTLMIEFCVPMMQMRKKIQDFDFSKIKEILQVYLKYPHENFGCLIALFLAFTNFKYPKISKVLFDLCLFDLNEIKNNIKKTSSSPDQEKERLSKMDLFILQSEFLYLFRLYFKTPESRELGTQDEKTIFDIKSALILKEVLTDAMKNSFLESISTYEEAVNVAKLLLEKNRKFLEKENRDQMFTIKTGTPFLENMGTTLYEPSRLAAMTYSYLPYYATNSKLKRKLANHAYGLWVEYQKNLPSDAHYIDKIETLKFIDLSLELAVISDIKIYQESDTATTSVSKPYEVLKKTFKIKIELLTLIKKHNLEDDKYFDTFYLNCSRFPSQIGSPNDHEVKQVCVMFAEFIKKNKRAATLFKSMNGKEFDESKITTEELLKMMFETCKKPEESEIDAEIIDVKGMTAYFK